MERNVSFTVKTREGSLVTIRADEPEEFVARVHSALANDDFTNAVEFIETVIRSGGQPVEVKAVQTIQSVVGGQVVSTPENPNFAPVAPPVGASSPTPAAATAGSQQCAHGTMVKRTGQGQYGEWRGYFCPTPKGTSDQCKPVYLKKSQPEWAAF